MVGPVPPAGGAVTGAVRGGNCGGGGGPSTKVRTSVRS
jgi:hypothetical protein